LARASKTPSWMESGSSSLATSRESTSRGAERQGLSRYERGIAAFEAAREFAMDRSWVLNWNVVDVPGAGHSSAAMYGGPEVRAALFGAAAASPEVTCPPSRAADDHTAHRH
jgi:hypothetical protein